MQIWVFPPGLILSLMLVGFILIGMKKKSGNKLLMLAFLLFWLLSTPWLGQALIDGLQKRYTPLNATQQRFTGTDTAIVVLGSGVDIAPEYQNKDVASEETMSRVIYAAYLSRHTQLPIIVSGGNSDQLAHYEADLMRDLLQDNYGITVKAVETQSHNTEEQSQMLVPILKRHAIKTVYLVTHAWHMPRSIYAFEESFHANAITVIPAPMGFIALKSDSFVINLLPSINALRTSVYAMHEYLGLAWYHFYHAVMIN